jgi:hypothetical protein
MAELPERFKPWAEREGLVEVGRIPALHAQKAVVRSLFTMDRAVELFDRVVAHLGERAWIDPEGGETRRRCYLRDREDPDWLLPVPLLEHAWIAGIGQMVIGTFVNSGAVTAEDAPQGWTPGDEPFWPLDPTLDILPQSPNMQGGSLKIAEGTGSVEIEYDDRGVRASASWSACGDIFWYGRAFNTRPWVIDPLARPPTPMPFSLACRPELDINGHTVDQMVAWVIELEPERLLPHRVLLPLPMPGGVAGAWGRARWALREAAFEGRLPDDAAGWVVIDAFEGGVMAVGPDFASAVARWRDEVARVRPRPPKPDKRDEPEPRVPDREPELVKDDEGNLVRFSTGTVRLTSPVLAHLAWPIPLPQHVPAAAVPLPPLPSMPEAYRRAGFSRVLRMFGEHGAVTHGMLREEADGFTVVGEGLLDVVDPTTVGEEIDAATARHRAEYADMPVGFPNPFDEDYPCETLRFRCWDDARRCRVPLSHVGSSFGTWTARNIDGDGWAWVVVRVRHR